MIYIIKEDKSPEFTWLGTLKSGYVNSVCSCSANHVNSLSSLMNEGGKKRQQMWHELASLTLFPGSLKQHWDKKKEEKKSSYSFPSDSAGVLSEHDEYAFDDCKFYLEDPRSKQMCQLVSLCRLLTRRIECKIWQDKDGCCRAPVIPLVWEHH